MKPIKYSLEVYLPDNPRDVWMSFEASSPFAPICVGEFINPGLWPSSKSPQKILQVASIEHAIWDSEVDSCVKHKVMVYSREVENTPESRLPG